MEENVLLLPVGKFEEYIKTKTLDKIDKEWLLSWEKWDATKKVGITSVIPAMRYVHYIGFLSGALSSAKGDLKWP